MTIPFKKGAYTKTEDMAVLQNGISVLIQPKVTARYDDGSIRYLFLRFLADLPANKAAVLQFDVKAKAGTNSYGQAVTYDAAFLYCPLCCY